MTDREPDGAERSSSYAESERMEVKTLALDYVERELTRQHSFIGSLYTRATVLLGASGITSAIITQNAANFAWLMPLGCFIAAIVLAVLSLGFKSADEAEPSSLSHNSDIWTLEQAHQDVLDARVETYESRNDSLKPRVKLLNAGMILFGAGWLTVFLLLTFTSLFPFPMEV